MQGKRLTSMEAFPLRVPAEGSAGDDVVESRLHVHRHVLQWNLDIIAAIVVTITASSKWLAVSAAANAHQMHLCPVQKSKRLKPKSRLATSDAEVYFLVQWL